MSTHRISVPTLVVAWLAVLLGSSGFGYAATKYTGKDIAANAVASKQVKDGSLKTADVLPDTVAAMSARGAKGDVGATGPAGPAGPTGTAGVQGPAGAKGPTGFQGAPGPQGIQGGVGPQGPSGIKGMQVVSVTDTVALNEPSDAGVMSWPLTRAMTPGLSSRTKPVTWTSLPAAKVPRCGLVISIVGGVSSTPELALQATRPERHDATAMALIMCASSAAVVPASRAESIAPTCRIC